MCIRELTSCDGAGAIQGNRVADSFDGWTLPVIVSTPSSIVCFARKVKKRHVTLRNCSLSQQASFNDSEYLQ